jgi:GTP-binding protein
MKITDARFIKSISINDDKIFFESRNEVVFVGRSNVWKSSLMNTLMHKKDLVKTSSKPGKTRTANIFFVNEKYHFTDLPGYGFAKLGQELREDLDALISWYLEEKRHTIKQVILICDAKIGPQQTDIDMYNYISELELPVTVLLSKIDKLGKNDVNKSKAHTEKTFFWARVLPISSTKLQGIDELRKIIWEELKK